MSRIYQIDELSVKVANEEILHRLGYGADRVPQGVQDMIDEVASQATKLFAPRAAYRSLTNEEYAHSHFLCHIGELVACVVTIGSDLENAVTVHKDAGDLSRALILDHCGAVAVDAAVDAAERVVQDHVARLGLKCSRRFSPGSSGWNIEERKWILPALEADRIGVTLGDSARLIPRQSRTFAVTIGDHPVEMWNPDICDYCGMVNCRFKNAPDKHKITVTK